MLSYGLLLQLLVSLIIGAILASVTPSFITGLPIAYIFVSLLISPITYSLSNGFRKYFDAEGASQLALVMQAAQVLGETLLEYILFLILSIENNCSSFIVLGSQIAFEVILSGVTCFIIFPRKDSQSSLQFHISHIKDFKI